MSSNARERYLANTSEGFGRGVCRRFDGALTGLGGCPFAGDELVGNIATETILAALASRGVEAEVRPEALAPCIALTEEIRTKFSHAEVE